jgi:hypothetical protein
MDARSGSRLSASDGEFGKKNGFGESPFLREENVV